MPPLLVYVSRYQHPPSIDRRHEKTTIAEDGISRISDAWLALILGVVGRQGL